MSYDNSLPVPPILEGEQISLFIDFDGTLVDVGDDPEPLGVSPLDLLAQLNAKLEGRLALVSGLSIEQLEGYLGLTTDISLVGSHGAEIRHGDMEILSPSRPSELDLVYESLTQTLEAVEGVAIEVRSFAVSINYRQAPQVGELAIRLAHAIAHEHGLQVEFGKNKVEVRTKGQTKGSSIEKLMSFAPFSDHVPVFVGDDLTDETGFQQCDALGGFGILVGRMSGTAAKYGLKNIDAVHEWLQSIT